MTSPNVPGYPRGRLPSVREVDSTSGAPHTPVAPAPRQQQASAPEPISSPEIAVQGRGWSVSVVAVTAVISSVAGIFGGRAIPQERPVAVPAELAEINARLSSIERTIDRGFRKSGSETDQLESSVNDVHVILERHGTLIEKHGQILERLQAQR